MSSQRLILLVLVVICASYANHFQNSFHFDDSHTIVDNPSIRSLANIPAFFTDSSTFTVLPANRGWRPLLSTSLAIDYWLGGGLKTTAFHVSTFLWFLVLVWIVYRLAVRVFDYARPRSDNGLPACFAAAWYGLHPVCAETVNYIIQRADLYVTLGAAAGIYLYAARPQWRRFGIYLVPVIAALLSKPPALIFPALLFAYILLFENRTAKEALRDVLPSLGVTAVLGFIAVRMTPPQFNPGAFNPFLYRITQPYVTLRYFVSFFLPTHLSADTELGPLRSAVEPEALLGFAFVAMLAGVAWICWRRRDTAPIAFGLAWFLLALIPTAVFALAEVENDHRMFFPFVGLAIATVWVFVLAAARFAIPKPALAATAVVVLAASAWGTYGRNQVWLNESTLWKDVTVKSPHNGRGLMNYALTLMSAGQYLPALQYMQRALVYTPNYHILEINLGIVLGQLGQNQEAEAHFRRAIALAPAESLPYHFYASYLQAHGRTADAIVNARQAAALNPSYVASQVLLRTLEAEAARQTAQLEKQTKPTAESYLDLSLRYHQAHRYEDSIRAARQAIELKPNFPEAYNNIAAAYEELGDWDKAIEAASKALQLKPDYTLARNNLAWSISQKSRRASK